MTVQLSERSWRSKDEHSIAAPQLIGYFSVDEDNIYLPDSSKFLYCNPRDRARLKFPLIRNRRDERVRFDLNEGIESMIRRSYSPDYGKLLFKWIEFNHNEIEASAESKRWIQPNFVCNSALLSKVFCTPYSERECWKIRAAKFKGTIYLSYRGSGFHMCQDDARKLRYWAKKFEQYILSDSPDEVSDTSVPIVESEEFRGVYKLALGPHKILFDAPVQGVISETPLTDPLPLNDLKFIQLRLRRICQVQKQEHSFRRYQLLKWWTQGFLANADVCLFGLRDDEGIVHRLTTYTLEDMIAMCESYWKPTTCIDFCEAFLGKISETVVNDCFEKIYQFERKSGEGGIHITTLKPSNRYTVIPPSFTGEAK